MHVTPFAAVSRVPYAPYMTQVDLQECSHTANVIHHVEKVAAGSAAEGGCCFLLECTDLDGDREGRAALHKWVPCSCQQHGTTNDRVSPC